MRWSGAVISSWTVLPIDYSGRRSKNSSKYLKPIKSTAVSKLILRVPEENRESAALGG